MMKVIKLSETVQGKAIREKEERNEQLKESCTLLVGKKFSELNADEKDMLWEVILKRVGLISND